MKRASRWLKIAALVLLAPLILLWPLLVVLIVAPVELVYRAIRRKRALRWHP